MISLGPLSPKKYCTYSCPFCYVHSGFLKYKSWDIHSIKQWLHAHKDAYDIIYVSGDTDSFAKPRTELGLQLLESLVAFDVDVLFTTRHVFHTAHLRRIRKLSEALAKKGNTLFGCVSVAQLNHGYLEPKPIRPPLERIEQLRRFKEAGLCTILAMRPFLPVVPKEEYREIINLSEGAFDIALGESWYVDNKGILEKKVFHGMGQEDIVFEESTMDFDDNEDVWKVWKGEAIEALLRKMASEKGFPFFMRSRPAIEWYRKSKKRG